MTTSSTTPSATVSTAGMLGTHVRLASSAAGLAGAQAGQPISIPLSVLQVVGAVFLVLFCLEPSKTRKIDRFLDTQRWYSCAAATWQRNGCDFVKGGKHRATIVFRRPAKFWLTIGSATGTTRLFEFPYVMGKRERQSNNKLIFCVLQLQMALQRQVQKVAAKQIKSKPPNS